MECEIVQTDQAPAAIGPYSQAVGAGPFLFVSGQLGMDPETGELVSPDFELQARQALENLRQVIQAAGCQLNKVTHVDIFLSNMSNFSKLNSIYEEFFGGHRPARAVIEVSGLPKGATIEIKCIVYRE